MQLENFLCIMLAIAFGLNNCLEANLNSCLKCSNWLIGPICGPYCPSNYSEFSNPNRCSYSNSVPLLFSSDFSKINDPSNTNSYDYFYNPQGSNFFTTSKLAPLKTKDRGLYFSNESYMKTDINNYEISKIAPNNSIKAWVLIENYGTFLSAYDSQNESYYNISANKSGIEAGITTFISPDYVNKKQSKLDSVLYPNAWVH
ncbi:hypothetical protein SteCoe_39254 [Stentor coeruleus]|uniref:Uncharacterized protein n=1 Tax=Stentor coeruleus TaxID=5963 RepID=A0A1R2AKQ4_9CILI|nr:hypothetical protein SteCoe_39254 [Stentor coeruleus]